MPTRSIRPTIAFRVPAEARRHQESLGLISLLVILASGLVATGSIGVAFISGAASIGGIVVALLLLLSVLVVNALAGQ
jgi:hypothetical protein